jgi:hypothetical protein
MSGLLEPADDGKDNVVDYNRRGVVPHKSAHCGGGGGGGVDDILRRLGTVETHVSELKSPVGSVVESISELRSQVAAILAVLPHLASKADIVSIEARIIKWVVASTLTSASVAFTIAKFVH